MKRQRNPLYLTVAGVLVAFAVTGYAYYLGEQSRALLKARNTTPAVERYARVQEAMAPEPVEGATPERPAKVLPEDMQPMEDRPMGDSDPETRELLEGFAQAKEAFSRFHEKRNAVRDDRIADIINKPASAWSEKDWAAIRTFLAENNDLLEEVRAFAAATGPAYPLDFSRGFAILLPHLAPMREMARLLRASAAVRASAGDVEGASADFLAGLGVGARLEDEPVLMSQLVRFAIDSMIYQGVVDTFPPGQIPPGLAGEIAGYINSSDTADLLVQAMHTEGDMGLQRISGFMTGGWQQGRDLLTGILPEWEIPGGRLGANFYASPFARPWHHLDMMSFDRYINRFEETLSLPYYEARPELDQMEREIAALPPTRVFTQGVLPSVLNIHRALARDQTLQQLFLLGTAAESYQNEHGAYPETLEAVGALAGGISTIDVHTGAPFRYTAGDEGFQLYSVGPNLSDDGAEHDFRDGDIVWRGGRPRTAEKRW